MRALCLNCDEIDEKIISTSWRKTGIIDFCATNNLESEEEIETYDVEGEDDCVGFVSDTYLVQIGLRQLNSN